MLQYIVDKFIYNILKLNPQSHIVQSVNFFVYDSIKILMLLFVMITAIGFLRTFVNEQKIKQWIQGKGILANIAASLFGAVTPFCSCSSIPLFFGFLKAGIPVGVTFSFLITSPLINEYLVVLMFGFFGWKITLAYIISGMLLGIITGVILGKLKVEAHIEKDMIGCACPDNAQTQNPKNSFKKRIFFGMSEAFTIVKRLWLWILIGVGLGSVIHNYVPEETIHSVVGSVGIFSVPIAVLIGVPMYGSCAAILPIALVLFQKGFPLGTALAFMMAVSALSLPEAVMLKRAMKMKLIIIFFSITTLGIIIIGYLINALQKILI